MPLLANIRAVLDNGVDHGKFRITTTGSDATSDHSIGITGPGGVIVKAFPGSPDAVGTTTYLSLHNLPVDSSGAYLQGDYIFHIATTGTIPVDDTQTFCLSYVDGAMVLSVIADCYSKSLVIDDNTAYPTGTVTRLITVSTPNIPGESDIADQSYSTEQVVIDMVRSSGNAYSNVTYIANGTASVETSDTTIVSWDVGYILAYTGVVEERLIRCDTDACGIISCVNDSIQALIAKACSVGGLSRLPKQEADNLVLIQVNLAMYNYYNQCRDNTQALYYYDELKKIVGTCDCEETGPTVIADSSFTYLRGYSAYEIWIQEGNVGTEDDFLSSLYPITDWVEVDDAYYANNFIRDTADPLFYRLTKAHIEFKGSFRSTIGATSPTSPTEILGSAFNPSSIDPQGFCTVRNDGAQVAFLYRDTDLKWRMHWQTGFNRTKQQFVSGQIPLDGFLSTTTQLNALGWTLVPVTEYVNSHTSSDFSFRTDGKYVTFRGSITGVGTVTTGTDVVNDTYFPSVGVVFEENVAVSAIDVVTNDLLGYVKVVSGKLRFFAISGAVLTNGMVFEGIIPTQ